MKKAILIVLMALVLVIPAYAAERDAATDQPIQQEQEPVVVATLDELQAAIETAEDGDTIYIANTISISGEVIETDKDIVITHSDEFCGTMFRIKDGTIISGFKFIDNSNGDDSNITIGIISAPDEVVVRQCSFNCSGNGLVRFIDISGGILETFAKIENCTFNGATNGAISAKGNTDVVIDSCIFNGNSNYLPGGSISTSGKLFIRNSVISGGSATSGGGILNSGELTISGCQINDNTVVSPKYGSDIFSIGTLTIFDIVQENYNYYEESTGEKVVLPLVDYKNDTKLICLTEEQAADYFAPAPDDNKDEDPPPEQPQEPGDQTGDDDTIGEELPPHGGNEDDPIDTPPQTPEQPEEPPQGDTSDKPVDTTPDTPQPPQKPSDGDNSGDDNYDYRPSQRPIWPVVTVKPTEDNKPQDQPENNPAPAKPQLACNGTVIDASRTVVLLGYGDGLLHESDPLTRAQLATIIFRLLDDDSIALYSNTQVTFTDVAADAWYASYVRVIRASGIVNGVGGGRYDPNGKVTWAQIVTILTRFVEPQQYTLQHIQYSGWAEQAIQTAVVNGWIEDSAEFYPDAIISRGQLVDLVNRVLAMYR